MGARPAETAPDGADPLGVGGADEARNIPRTLVLTGHFPPEPGGVQTFTWELVRRLPADRLLVVAPAWPGAGDFDAGLGFPVVRRRGYLLFRRLRRLVRQHELAACWITAMAPFGLYAPFVRAAGMKPLVASSHGQELGWVRALPTRLAMRGMTRAVDTLTYLSEATLRELRLGVAGRTRLVQLPGGVDCARFAPDLDAGALRDRYAPAGGPLVLSVSRLVRRKGHDVLLRAWREVVRREPRARLVVVGDGPMRRRLAEDAAGEFPDSVVFAGPVPPAELPPHYAAADVFVAPCRDDRRELQTEGLGLSTLEAAASGLPVVVGRSGGSAMSVRDGHTGLVVDARGPAPVAGALLTLITRPDLARAMGAAGRRWALEHWAWEHAAARLAAALRGDGAPHPRRS
ncbi:MAG TPA: glycosyltransferase family 4 protein [Streptosporangiaceae bacterium]|nr:glycosyltransferase family 4 protein [Streptosporangiaceae bacterium]